jgi:hypothetical protein
MDKHSSLLRKSVNYWCKKIYSTGLKLAELCAGTEKTPKIRPPLTLGLPNGKEATVNRVLDGSTYSG